MSLADFPESTVRGFEEILRRFDQGTIWISNADFTEFEYVSPGFEEIWGISREQLDDDPLAFVDLLHPDDREEVFAVIGALREGETAEPEIFTAEYRIVQSDDSLRWVKSTVFPVTDDDGTIVARAGHTFDVTQHRRSEQALQTLYEIASTPDLSFEEKLSRMLDLGRERLDLPYGYLTRIEDGVQHIVDVEGTHPLLQQGERCPLSQAYCRKTIETDSLLGMHDVVNAGWEADPAYEQFDFGAYIGGKVFIDDELYGTICFAATEPRDREFTRSERRFVELLSQWASYELERGQARERLERQNERLEQFASVVSHDIRNPLSTAIGYLDLAREEGTDEQFDRIEESLDRIDRIVDDLLYLAREGQDIGQTAPVALRAVAEDAWRVAAAHDSDATLVFADEPIGDVDADYDRLRQLLENVFRNSLEHAGCDVTVTLSRTDTGFAIVDDGPGIDPAHLDQAFVRGFTTSDKGTGFGLAIVREIAEAHGWDVELANADTGGLRLDITTA